MRIFICTMDDPVYTLPFIKEIIDARRDDIVGVAVSKGDRLTIGKNRSKFVYPRKKQKHPVSESG